MISLKLINCIVLSGTLAGVVFCGSANAQSNDLNMGYIFFQPFVERIDINERNKLLGKDIATPFDFNNDLQQINSQKNLVSRSGTTLTIKIPGRSSVILSDFSIPYSSNVDGDSQLYRYRKLELNAKSKDSFHVVIVFFGHDQPHMLLINSQTGKMYFVDEV